MAEDQSSLSEQHESAQPSATTRSQTHTKLHTLGSTTTSKVDGSEKEPPASPLEESDTAAITSKTSFDVDESPNTDPNESCHGCGKLNEICSCKTDELVGYSQDMEKPTSVDRRIVDVSTKTTDTTPLPQETSTPRG